jgi:hypothetical protein
MPATFELFVPTFPTHAELSLPDSANCFMVMRSITSFIAGMARSYNTP